MKPQPETAKQPRIPFRVTTGKYRFKRAADCVRQANKPLTVWQLAEQLDVNPSEAETMSLRAVRAGLLVECRPRVFALVDEAAKI